MVSSYLSLALPACCNNEGAGEILWAGSDHTFMGRLWVRRKWDVIQLSQAEPFSIHRHSEFAKVDGLHGSLCDLVSGGGWHIGWRRQSRHDDSAGTTTHKHTHTPDKNKTSSPKPPKSKALEQSSQGVQEVKKEHTQGKISYGLRTKCSR